MRSVLTIARLALKECIRDKLFIGLSLCLLLYLVFSVYFSTLSLGSGAKFLKDFGMMGISLISLAVSILFGMFSLYREKERRELYVLLYRIPRHSYILGRFSGTVLLLALFSLAAGCGIFLLIRLLEHQLAPELFWASYTAVLEFALLSAVGFLFYALGVGFVLNSLMLLLIYFIGQSLNLAIESFVALGMYGSKTHLALVNGLSYVIPNFDLFNFRLAIVHAEPIDPGRVALATLYGLFYVGALLAVSAYVFNRKDI
jgi:hypothetical protein